VIDSPPFFAPESLNNRLSHIAFNRVNDELTVRMVRGNEAGFYRYEFAVQSGGRPLPEYAQDYYVRLFRRSRGALRGSFGLYRAWDITTAQNRERKARRLTIPVLGIGGANSWGARAGDAMRSAAVDVQTVVIPGAGHWVAEQAPPKMLAALTEFLRR
jgi:pimeloyl-ACP methyl ester carboxylesterase